MPCLSYEQVSFSARCCLSPCVTVCLELKHPKAQWEHSLRDWWPCSLVPFALPGTSAGNHPWYFSVLACLYLIRYWIPSSGFSSPPCFLCRCPRMSGSVIYPYLCPCPPPISSTNLLPHGFGSNNALLKNPLGEPAALYCIRRTLWSELTAFYDAHLPVHLQALNASKASLQSMICSFPCWRRFVEHLSSVFSSQIHFKCRFPYTWVCPLKGR